MKHLEQINEICGHFHTTIEQLLLNRRTKEVVENRHLVMYWYKKNTNMTFCEIGKIFNKDHTTVMHAVTNAENLIKYDDIVRAKWELIKKNNPYKKAEEEKKKEQAKRVREAFEELIANNTLPITSLTYKSKATLQPAI